MAGDSDCESVLLPASTLERRQLRRRKRAPAHGRRTYARAGIAQRAEIWRAWLLQVSRTHRGDARAVGGARALELDQRAASLRPGAHSTPGVSLTQSLREGRIGYAPMRYARLVRPRERGTATTAVAATTTQRLSPIRTSKCPRTCVAQRSCARGLCAPARPAQGAENARPIAEPPSYTSPHRRAPAPPSLPRAVFAPTPLVRARRCSSGRKPRTAAPGPIDRTSQHRARGGNVSQHCSVCLGRPTTCSACHTSVPYTCARAAR